MAQFKTQRTGFTEAFFTTGASRKFRGAQVNVIPFGSVIKGTAYTELILYETHKHSTALCVSLLYRTVPKYENKCGNCDCTYVNK